MKSSVSPNKEKMLEEGSKKADAAAKLADFSFVKLLGMVGITNCVGVLEKCDKGGKNGNEL